MKKRILFIIDSLNCGGAEKSLISLLPLLDYDRLDVNLLIFRRGLVFEKYLIPQVNIVNYNIFKIRSEKRVRNFFHQLDFSIRLRLCKRRHKAEIHWLSMHKIIKCLDDKYDVAIAYQQGLPTFFLATKVYAHKKIAWINADIMAAGYDMKYCRQFYDRMDNVVAVSEKLQEKLCTVAPWMSQKLHCIYDIINPDVIRRLAQEPVTDMPAPAKGEITIVTVGRLTKPKNHLLAVDAAKILVERGLSFKWFFVGEGEEMKSAIEERIAANGLQQNVFLLGLKENPYPYMARADIYVQTSSFEGFGMTIAEAKVLHCPIVCTNFDVVHDQIIDHQNGLITEMTPNCVADKIIELHQDERLRLHLINSLEKESNNTSLTEVEKFNELIDD